MRCLLLLSVLFVAPCATLLVGARPAAIAAARPNALRRLRMDEAPPPPPSSRLGATIDQDGKSNVWAVEPAMKVDSDSSDKGLLAFAPVAGVAALALLAIPLLP